LWSPFRKSAASITATNVGLPEGFAPVVHYDRGVRINTNDCSGARQDNRVRISSANQNHFPQQDRRRSCSAGNVAPRDSLKRLSVKYGCDGLFGSDSLEQYGAAFFQNYLANPQSKLLRLTKVMKPESEDR
jgi:hypothetical protein